MLHSRRCAARIWHAIVLEAFLCVCPYIIAHGALALIIVDKVMATSWKTCSLGTIGNIRTHVQSIFDDLLESTVTFTAVVLGVIASWVLMVFARTIRTTLISFTIVHVQAPCMDGNGAICLTMCSKLQWTL